MHETGGGDNLALWISLNGWNGGGLTRDSGLIESEADGAEKGGGLLVGIGLEIRIDITDESRADGREQTCLQEQMRYLTRADGEGPTNIKVVLRSSSYFVT